MVAPVAAAVDAPDVVVADPEVAIPLADEAVEEEDEDIAEAEDEELIVIVIVEFEVPCPFP